MTDEPKRYRIETLADIMALPLDRLPRFLTDLEGFLALKHAAADMGAKTRPTMVWIDDNKHDIHANFWTPDGTKLGEADFTLSEVE
jgi:hypothetical protein